MMPSEEQFEALARRVSVIEEREQMPLAYQAEARELAEALDTVQRVDAEKLADLERRLEAAERPWWKKILRRP